MNSDFTPARDLEPGSLSAIAQVLGEAETGELLRALINGLEGALVPMQQALQEGDLRSLGRLAHKHAGGCGSLGAMNLQARLRRIEQAAQQAQNGDCAAELAAMPGMVARLRAAADAYLRLAALAG